MSRNITMIVIHCSDSPNGRLETVKDIDAWHRERGFKRLFSIKNHFNPDLTSIGYHYVIYVDGSVHTGRAPSEVGAHVAGYNSRSLGICMIGASAYTPAQWQALRELIVKLQVEFPAVSKVVGHRDLSPDKNGNGKLEPSEWLKACPGFSVKEWCAGSMAPLANHLLEVKS